MDTYSESSSADQQALPLTATERHQVIELFNATQAEYPKERLIHELVEEQVNRAPDALAVAFEGQSLTYAELNAKANQLAWFLRNRGVGPDQRVGICVERSLEMVVTLLGIWKAGGAYVPLDPAYPPERLAFMVADAAPHLLLTQERLRERLPATAETIAVDCEGSLMGQKVNDLCADVVGLKADHLAYVIYTSGSTGEPKGVMVEHRHVTLLWEGLQELYARTAGCRHVALNASITFDASVQQLVQLLSGQTLYVMPENVRRDPVALLSFLENQKIDVIDCTPSQLKTWVDAGLLDEIARKPRIVLVGGEAIDTGLWRRLSSCKEIQFYNVYAPTECTVDATVAQISGDTSEPHIGRPMHNRRIYILDQQCQPVPIGVAGEIYIGGAGVARGYLNRPESTTERFLSDPFSLNPDARMYKTGDLGQWRPNGTIEYLRRNDHQVKIRGFRVELGEIEAQLTRHPAVKEAVVLTREDEPGEKRLVAYVVGHRQRPRGRGLQASSASLRDAAVADWKAVLEETYLKGATNSRPSFVGWNSSYTGKPIPEPEMQEWLACTINRIMSLRPRKVLEIGCGVGLLLERLAPLCENYVGTDFSHEAISQVHRWVDGNVNYRHVTLLRRAALELQELPGGSFDTVILNSVVQFFPDLDYLLKVLGDSIRLVRSPGHIFIGDVRHFGLLPTFHSALQLQKAPATLGAGALSKRIVRAIAQDKDLVIDPTFFESLPGVFPAISAADVLLKRGKTHNEVTNYRFDVTLEVSEEPRARPEFECREWNTAIDSLSSFSASLEAHTWNAIRLCGIPNSRLIKDSTARKLIEASDDRASVETLRNCLQESSSVGLDPEEVCSLAESHGYTASLHWSERGSPHEFDISIVDPAREHLAPHPEHHHQRPEPSWDTLSNDPLETASRRQLITQLRKEMRERLPDYMVPSAYVVMKEFPLTSNGKLDRRALPRPTGRPDDIAEYMAPRSDLERLLAGIWEEVLHVDQVGVLDNFFELGGNSLLGMKLLAGISDILAVKPPLLMVFSFPTVAEMAKRIEVLRSDDRPSPELPQLARSAV